jgi:hypothetical protein
MSNGSKILPNGHKIYQHFPFQGPPKFTRFGIFLYEKNIWQPWLWLTVYAFFAAWSERHTNILGENATNIL